MVDIEHIAPFLIPGTSDEVTAWYAALPAAAAEPLALVEREVVVMDTETTGFDAAHDQLIEVAACVLRGTEVVDRFQTFVNPGRHIPDEITELTGIADADVAGSPDPSLAVELFAEFAGQRAIVAHNASFDQRFVMCQAVPGALTGEWLDSLALSRIVLPRMKSHRLADLARAFDLHSSNHRAADDVEALAQLWCILCAAAHRLPAGLAQRISELAPDASWPLRPVFADAAAAMPGVDFSLRRCRQEQVRAEGIELRADAQDEPTLAFPTEDEVRRAFSAEGTAGAMYEGYEPRAEQVEMALEVTEALRTGTHRVLEAGTGVGKSMAYLLPFACVARANHITCGVATKTNALMDQLVYHELPRLSAVLGGLRYVALKGYEHYPCLRKVENMARDEREAKAEVIEMLAMLHSFTAQTVWGDLDALNLHWRGLPRYAIEASSADCLKNKCPFFPRRCYLHGARRAARGADVVVTNHALLFRDIQADNGILPPIRHWVVDEAHAVEDEARRQLSHTVSALDLEALFNRMTGRNGVLSVLRRKAMEVEGANILHGALTDADERILQIRTIATSFFSFVKELANVSTDANSSYDRLTLWVGPQLRESVEWSLLLNPGRSLAKKLDALVERLRDLTTMTEQFDPLASMQADLASATSTLAGTVEALTLVLDGEDGSFVYSVELNRATEHPAEQLSAAKLDIGAALADNFYPNTSSVIYTSATLATGSHTPFGYFMHASGMDLLPPERVGTRQLASSYDFEHNMQVLLPARMPEPSAFGYKAALAQLLMQVHTAMGGSVLTLFTNRREMEELYYQLKPQLQAQGIDLIAQTRGTSTKSLRDRFLADEQLCLFALRSFWEGFDAPGDTLRCVVIPKLPFGRPTDPLSREREQREGRNAWGRYSLPAAVMDVKQAAGRLIRNSTDSGFLVLADSRLQTKGYGRTFLDALPTGNIKVIDERELQERMRTRCS